MLDISIEQSTVLIHTICICVSVFFLIYSLSSLDSTKYQRTRIGDEGATALADVRVINNFKTLK